MSADDYGDTMIEALRRANPVPVREAESRRALPSGHALFAEIIAEPPRRAPRRVRSRTVVIVIAIILILLALVAFVAVRKDTPTQTTSIVCYSAADRDAKQIVVGSSGDAKAACATVWKNGDFAALGVKTRASTDFDVCVLPTGVAAVFPGESGSVCPALHLPEAAGGDTNVAGFAAEVDGKLNATCMQFAPAERIVKRELEKWRLAGWTIKRAPNPYDAGHPCASIAVDGVAHVAGIVPYPGPNPPTT